MQKKNSLKIKNTEGDGKKYSIQFIDNIIHFKGLIRKNSFVHLNISNYLYFDQKVTLEEKHKITIFI